MGALEGCKSVSKATMIARDYSEAKRSAGTLIEERMPIAVVALVMAKLSYLWFMPES